jgi:Trypsin-co-occurring domain 1
MNRAASEGATRVVSARLPSGIRVGVEVSGPDSGDAMTSVGMRDFNLSEALDTVAQIGTVVVEKLKAAKPTKATVELRLGFALEAGKLTALWVNGKGDASLTVTLEWAEPPAPSAPAND